MGLSHSPRIVTNNLLLNLDFANVKNYDGRENLCLYSDLPLGGWASNTPGSGYAAIYTPNTTDTTDPFGTNKAAKVAESGTGYQRIAIGCTTTNGVTSIHTWSVYVKQGNSTICSIEMSGGWTGGGHANFNFSTLAFTYDGSMNQNLSYQSVGNGWYRLSGNFTPGSTSGTIWLWPSNVVNGASTGLYTYFSGMQIERGSYVNPYVSTTSSAITRPSSITSSISSYSLSRTNATRSYAQYNNGVMNFTRAASADSTNKNVAGDNFQATVTQTNLKPSTFLYNDFTWEVWFKPNDLNPSNYDVTEGVNAIIAFRGWHQGFTFDTSNLIFWILSDTSGGTWNNIATTTGTSSGNVRQGNWHQVVVTRSGNLYTMYVNGVSVTSATKSSIVPIADGAYTTNELHIGGYKYSGAASTDGYFWHSKMDFACTNMYNRALSAAEVKQNFNALRGRFGI